MDTKTGMVEALDEHMVEKLNQELKLLEESAKAMGGNRRKMPPQRMVLIPQGLARSFAERGPKMKDQDERIRAAKAARRKANKEARKARRKNRR